MPISRMMPISAMTLRSVLHQHQRQQRAHAGRGQRRQNGDRMDVALVQHAEHDVDGHQRGDESASARWPASPERPARFPESMPWISVTACRILQSPLALIAATASLSGNAWRQIERNRDGRELSLVIHGQRRSVRDHNGVNALSGTCCAVGGLRRKLLQSVRVLPELRRHLHHHVILVQVACTSSRPGAARNAS